MNRTDRLYALVEELRAVAPAHRSTTWLAERFRSQHWSFDDSMPGYTMIDLGDRSSPTSSRRRSG